MRSLATWVGTAIAAAVTVALAIVIVVGLFGLGFSGSVGDDYAELVDPDAPRPFDLVITEATGSSVELEGGDTDELGRGSVWGLEYPGGYGKLGAVTASADGMVSRVFELETGRVPVPGTVGRIDPITWSNAAGAGLDENTVAYDTELGSYPSLLVGPSSDAWLIVVHHLAQPVTEGLRMATVAADAGVATLLMSYRNDRDAPRSPRGSYQWGSSEWRDLEGAVLFARSQGADDVVLAGYGMGGSIVLSFLENSDAAAGIAGIVLDSPVIDVEAAVAHDLGQAQLGAVFDLPDIFNYSARLIAGWRLDFDWGELDYGDVDPGAPVLIIHGDDDRVAPLSESQAYAEAFGELVRLVVVEGAGFTESWNIDPESYARTVADFIGDL